MRESFLGVRMGPDFSADKGGGEGSEQSNDPDDYLPGGSEELPKEVCPDSYTDADLEAPAAGQRVRYGGVLYRSQGPPDQDYN